MGVTKPYDDFDFYPDYPFGELANYGRGETQEIKEEEKNIEKDLEE